MEGASGSLALPSRSDRVALLNSPSEPHARAHEVLETEIRGLRTLETTFASPIFARVVDLLLHCRGRIVVSGVGKSGLVATRIAASFRSTGTKSVFLHPTEAVHGDLGLVESEDVGLFLSKSGESGELLRLLPAFRRLPLPIVAVTAEPRSTLAREADEALILGPIEEAGPLDVVPTTSSTMFQVLGDALVTCLYAARGFRAEDLAHFHPGGLLGERVTTEVSDVMRRGDELPKVDEAESLRAAVMEMIAKKLGLTTVIDAEGRLVGILTDGDLRRIVHRHGGIDELRVLDVMTRNPKTVERTALLATAVSTMEGNPGGPITSLIVVDAERRPEGVLHLHDCLRLRGKG